MSEIEQQQPAVVRECEFDPDHLYHDHREVDALRVENEALRAALEWALEEGGWRLWYYAAEPLPEILEAGSVGDPARIKAASHDQ